jgi:hypothetical protein
MSAVLRDEGADAPAACAASREIPVSLAVFLADDLSPAQVRLTGAEGRHAAGAKRLRVGEQVELVDGRGTRARCTVVEVARDDVLLAVGERRLEPAPSLRLVVVQALPKGDRGELAVELMTEVGVDAVVPWAAARCVVQWKGERGEKALRPLAQHRPRGEQAVAPLVGARGARGSEHQAGAGAAGRRRRLRAARGRRGPAGQRAPCLPRATWCSWWDPRAA